jgi:hypothetical protein
MYSLSFESARHCIVANCLANFLVILLEKFSENEKHREIGERGEELVRKFSDLVEVLW